MAEIFCSIKQGARLSLRPLNSKRGIKPLTEPPRFFFPSTPGALMKINPLFKDVPFLQEKLKALNLLIRSDRATIAVWEASEPTYPLLTKVKEQLAANLKIWSDITGGQPCQ